MRQTLLVISASLTCLVSRGVEARICLNNQEAGTNSNEYGPTILKNALKIESQSNDRKLSKEQRDEYSRSYHIEIKHAYERLAVGSKAGDIESMFRLGAYCLTFVKEGFATERECLSWLEAAALKGHPDAPYNYAMLLLELDTPIERAKGLEWLKRAARAGNSRRWASAHLAYLYTYGDPGLQLRRDPKAAWMWIRKGAEASGWSEGDVMIERGLQNPDKIDKREIRYQ